jgi:hypothetical protein
MATILLLLLAAAVLGVIASLVRGDFREPHPGQRQGWQLPPVR